MRKLIAGDLLWRPGRHHLPALRTALRPQIDHPVRRLDHVEVVLDHHQRPPAVDQLAKRHQQLSYIVEMQPGGRLVQDVQHPASAALPALRRARFRSRRRQMRRQLHPLRFPAGKRRRRLPQPHVAQPNLLEHRQLVDNLRVARKKAQRFAHRHLQHLINAPALVVDLQRARLVARPVALLAGQLHIGQKLHLDRHRPVALAHIAAAPRHIEREVPRGVPPPLRLRLRRKQLADCVERLDVRHWIRPGRASDGRLIHQHNIVQPLHALDVPIDSRGIAAFDPPQPVSDSLVQHIVDQGRLPRSGNSGNRNQQVQRNVHVDAFEVVRARPLQPQPLLRRPRRMPPRRNWNRQLAAEITPGDRSRIRRDLLHRSRRQHLAPKFPGARAQIEQIIRRAQHVRIVLDHQDRVAQIAQLVQNPNQPRRVSRVQPDRRLIEHIERAHQARSQRRRQLNALRFPARQRRRQPIQGQVVQADGVEKCQPLPNLLQNAPRNLFLHG